MQAELLKGLGAIPKEESAHGNSQQAEQKEGDALAFLEKKIAAPTIDDSEFEIDAAAASEAKANREAAKKKQAEKKAMVDSIGSFFGDDDDAEESAPKTKAKANKGDKPLTGWKLKKAIRKAASEAEAKAVPVEKYEFQAQILKSALHNSNVPQPTDTLWRTTLNFLSTWICSLLQTPKVHLPKPHPPNRHQSQWPK